jgi:hypothetical protein
MALHRYKKFIWISFFLVVIAALIFYQYTKATVKAAQPTSGRDYRYLSLHPNGQEILFTECNDSLSTRCGIFRYCLRTQHLEHYNLPEGYAYLEASFSPKGNYVVMDRMPLPKESEEDEEKLRAVQQIAEIAIMKVNGQAFQVLPLPPGPKTGSIMSNGEDKVAYLTMTPRKPGSKSLFANFNVWEFDLNSLTYQLFAGDFRFFDIGNMQYIPDDQAILMGGELPSSAHREGLSVMEYFRRYNGSSIYILQRGEKTLTKPMFTDVKNAAYPSLDQQGNIYFKGEAEQWRFFKAQDTKIVQRWEGKWPFISTQSLVVSPDGNTLFAIHDLPDHDSRRGKYSRAIGKLDLISHTQQDVIIPPFNTAQVINVTPIK